MTTVYTTPEAISEEYKRTGQRYIQQAEAEFEKGDFLQASEKAWGAATQQVKALAVLRGLPHESHREIRIAASLIANEVNQDDIMDLFSMGESLHANYYEAWMPEREVRRRIDNMKEFIALLENVPPPNGDTPIRPPRARLFIRDRGDDI
jgi:uncharacterized protein (UPF0332 family)